MIDTIIANSDAFRWLFFIGLLWAFYRWMQGDDSNGIEWRDFVATKGLDGQYHGDIDKVGKSAAVFFGSVILLQMAPRAHTDFTGFALVITSYFGFAGAVAGYSAFLRSKNSRTETVVTSEPVVPPLPQKITSTKNEPAKPDDEMRGIV